MASLNWLHIQMFTLYALLHGQWVFGLFTVTLNCWAEKVLYTKCWVGLFMLPLDSQHLFLVISLLPYKVTKGKASLNLQAMILFSHTEAFSGLLGSETMFTTMVNILYFQASSLWILTISLLYLFDYPPEHWIPSPHTFLSKVYHVLLFYSSFSFFHSLCPETANQFGYQ